MDAQRQPVVAEQPSDRGIASQVALLSYAHGCSGLDSLSADDQRTIVTEFMRTGNGTEAKAYVQMALEDQREQKIKEAFYMLKAEFGAMAEDDIRLVAEMDVDSLWDNGDARETFIGEALQRAHDLATERAKAAEASLRVARLGNADWRSLRSQGVQF